MIILYIWLQVINEVKVTNQGEGHIKVKIKVSTFFPMLCQILCISTHYSSVYGYKSLIRSSSYIKVKVTNQSEGHIKVKVKVSTFFPMLCQILCISTHYSSVYGYKSLIRSSSYIKVKVTSRSK